MIRLGVDPDWQYREDAARERAFGEVLQALTEREKRKREEAKLAASMVLEYPDPDFIASFGNKHEKDPTFRAAVEQAKRRSGLNEKFFSAAAAARQDYTDTVQGAQQAQQYTPLQYGGGSPLAEMLASLGSMAQNATDDAQGRLLRTDPSGMEQGYAALSPGEQGMFAPYARKELGLGLDRFLPERPSLSNYSDPQSASAALARMGMMSPDELMNSVRMGGGMTARPGVMAEAEYRDELADANSTRDFGEAQNLQLSGHRQRLLEIATRDQDGDENTGLNLDGTRRTKAGSGKASEDLYARDLKALSGGAMTDDRANTLSARVERVRKVAEQLAGNQKDALLAKITPDSVSTRLQKRFLERIGAGDGSDRTAANTALESASEMDSAAAFRQLLLDLERLEAEAKIAAKGATTFRNQTRGGGPSRYYASRP